MVTNRSRPAGIIPTLYYNDVSAAIDWLHGAFGFEERFRYGPPEAPEGAQLTAGSGAIMLSKARTGQSPDWNDSARLGPPRSGELDIILSVQIEDIDAHYERAKAFGMRILHEPQTYSFGERQYTAEDVAGYRWAFSESVANIAPADWGAITPR